ncbi:MAG: hypothetical protein JWP22_3402 [Ramlibacter sp.]|jgi:hypothetical protein|nr:hypothetical protein [Ramlibacter sp.]MDB5914727.1 hypothetical protein [Ramlibacter sp.]
MDPRWQPHLGPVRPAIVTPEACDLLAAGWSAYANECWVGGDAGQAPRMVSPETWRSLRDRSGFVPPRLQMQERGAD